MREVVSAGETAELFWGRTERLADEEVRAAVLLPRPLD